MSIFTNEDIVSGSVDVNNFPASQPVTGPLTDTELRATPVPVTIPTPVPVTGTFFQATQPVSIALPVAVTGTFYQATQPISGSVSVSNFPATQPVSIAASVAVTGTFWQATQPVSGPLTDTQLRATPVPISGSVSTTPVAPTTIATVTSVAVSTTVATLSASNVSKKKVVVFNEAGTLYVKLGSAATSSSYSYRLTANSTLEIEDYAGIVTAIKASGSTNALVTEVGI
jgi:hypothetical protein